MDRIIPNLLNGSTDSIDELYHLEAKILEAVGALARTIYIAGGSANFKLTGAEASADGDDMDVTDGYVVIDGELIRVDAHTAEGPLGGGEGWYFEIQNTNIEESEDVDRELNPIYTREAHRAVLVRGSVPGGALTHDAASAMAKSNSYTSSSANSLATSKAVKDLNDALTMLIDNKQGIGSYVRFIHGDSITPTLYDGAIYAGTNMVLGTSGTITGVFYVRWDESGSPKMWTLASGGAANI